MSYEVWKFTSYTLVMIGLASLFVVPLVLYFITRRAPDALGKRRGRPITSIAAGFVCLAACSLLSGAITGGHQEYEQRLEAEIGVDRSNRDAGQRQEPEERDSSRLYQCVSACESPPECRNLAPLVGAGRTACNRARQSCRVRCYDRFQRG